MLIPIELLTNYEQTDALKNVVLKEVVHKIESKEAIDLDGLDVFLERRNTIAKSAIGPIEAELEAYYGDNELLPIAYLELGTLRSKAIGRIHFYDKKVMRNGVATGFLVSPDLVITNWHVFEERDNFQDAQIQFNCEYDCFGKEKERVVFELDPDRFFYSYKDLDLALIAVRGNDVTGKQSTKNFGFLPMLGGAVTEGLGDFATIIQHPEGKLKQIAIRENRILDVLDSKILTYYSDTAHGSSGSAVFNNQWQLIAPHSAGIAKKNTKGEYLDKDDNVIQPVGNSIPSEMIVWLKNKGIRMRAIVEHLKTAPTIRSEALVVSLLALTDANQFTLPMPITAKVKETEAATAASSPTLPFLNLAISISLGTGTPQVQVHPSQGAKMGELAFEKKYEDEMDYSRCTGYNSYFMEDNVPMPNLSASLRKKVAYLIDNPTQYILPYHHYSTIFHAARHMPVVSAINLKGRNRYKDLERKSNVTWYRDYRIDYDVQLDDDWYVYTGFDKGHLSRYEDAEWGTSRSYAEKAGIMTCSYTNACPQAPHFNRAVFGYTGIWGRLEQAILEEGVVWEQGDEGRICIFNGPIFEEEDPVFKGVQIPVRFYKIVVWRNEAKTLKATAFLLSQEKQLEDFEFEALRYDEIFKRSQVSISYIEKVTGLSFEIIRDLDTLRAGNDGEEERLITDDKDIIAIIHKNRYSLD